MAWKKGESGNPAGRTKDKPFAEALRIALAEDDDVKKKRKLRVIADKLVDAAIAGEPWAIKEVIDRVDGKPAQSIDTTIDDKRDLRDLNGIELAERAAEALRRVEELTAGAAKQAKSANGSADVRKLN